MKIREVVDALERFAPLPLQESFDNAGLQAGLTEAEVSGALLCLDVTEKVVDEAVALGCNLIVSHHPLIFHALKRITYADDVQRAVAKALKNDITVVSMHTNMDNARGGVNFKIAEKMELHDCRFFAEKTVMGIECGSGVIGELPEALAADDFVLMSSVCSAISFCAVPSRPLPSAEAQARSSCLRQLHREQTPLSQARCTIMSISAMSRKYRLPSLATIRANSILTKYLNQ